MTIQKPFGSKPPRNFSPVNHSPTKRNHSSDGPQPHFITVEFPSKVAIQKLSIFLCFPLDDSYTPSTMCIRAGTGPADLQDVRVVTLEKPDGWITFDISSEARDDGEGL
jgi:anaphase-promoting complex subunit 10